MKITIVNAYDQFDDSSVEQEILEPLGVKVHRVKELTSPEAEPLLREAAALMVGVNRVPELLLEKMEKCRIVARVGTGVDAIDIDAATQRGIWVTNVQGYAVDEVATHALCLLLALARRLPSWMKLTNQGEWNSRSGRPISRLDGQILGLVGFGQIGKAVAKKAGGVGLQVLVHDPYIKDDTLRDQGVGVAQWEELWSRSDFVSLHAPLTDETHEMVNDETLNLMKPTSFLINLARGGLVDEEALLNPYCRGWSRRSW